MPTIGAVPIGVGHFLPKRIVTNSELAKTVDTSDEWIKTRTGIERRHFAADDEFTSDLAIKAAMNALKNANISANDIDTIVLATSTPDQTFPSTATKVQTGLGMTSGFAFDVQAVCAGFAYALTIANSLIVSGQSKKILVIGAETFSRIMDWEDRTTCVLFDISILKSHILTNSNELVQLEWRSLSFIKNFKFSSINFDLTSSHIWVNSRFTARSYFSGNLQDIFGSNAIS